MFPSQSLRQWDLHQSAPNTRQTATTTRRDINPPTLSWNTGLVDGGSWFEERVGGVGQARAPVRRA